jgi:hypothetical protein
LLNDKSLSIIDDHLDSSNDFLISDLKLKEILKNVKTKINKQKKYKEKNKNFINKESLILRQKIQKEIFKIFDDLDILKNLNYHQFKALSFFRLHKPFKIIDCDKNVGYAIISNDLYDKCTLEYLNSDTAYKSIPNNQLDLISEKINTKLNELSTNNHISSNTNKTLKVKNLECKTGIFRMMAKVHKQTFGWRPILNCIDHPTSKLSILFDNLFKPFVLTSKSYIKDSQNLMQICENIRFKKPPFIYSLDISNLYPSIDPIHAVPILTEFMSKYLDTYHLTSFGLYSLLFLFFECNIFKYKTFYYIQIKGLPMGCICGPSLANLYLYILESKWLVIFKPLVYRRFIDDIGIIDEYELDKDHFESFFIYLKLTLSTGDFVSFLDTIISYNHVLKKIKFSLYTKPTHVNKYLLPSSNHPSHIFENIIHNLFLRIKRICSDYYDFIDASKQLSVNLLERGYESKKIRKVFNYISNIDRSILLPYKEKNNNIDFSKNIPFFFIFNCNFSNFNNILFNSYKDICKQFPILNNFSLKLINNIDINLQNNLVHNFNFSFPSIKKTSKCNNCRICNFIYKSSFIKLKNNHNLYMLSNGNCNSSNLIYIIICMKCNIFYIGETSNTLCKRISDHLDDIINFIPFEVNTNKEVAFHFNLKPHNYLYDFKCLLFRDNFSDDLNRKSAELDLVNFLNNFHNFKCINIITKNKNYNFLCFK